MEQVQRIAALFDAVAPTYDAVGVEFFEPIAAGLVTQLAPQPGERALDLGCGRGAALVPLARGVSPGGSAVGVDVSPRMVESAREAVSAAGLGPDVAVEVRVGDAQTPDLPAASYDVLASSLVLFFLPDPVDALRSWLRLLVPRGRLGVSTFAGVPAGWEEVDAVFRPYLPPGMLDARTSGRGGPFASDEGVAGLLADAGLTQVRTAGTTVAVRFADADHWYRWSWSVGQRAMWEAVPAGERPGVQAEAYRRLERCRDDDGRIGFDQRVRYTLGSAPGPGPAPSADARASRA